jgi:hypothetical protein
VIEEAVDLGWSHPGEGQFGELMAGEECGSGGFVAGGEEVAVDPFAEEEELVDVIRERRDMALAFAVEDGEDLNGAGDEAGFLLDFTGYGVRGRVIDVGPAAGDGPAAAVCIFPDEEDLVIMEHDAADIDLRGGVAEIVGIELEDFGAGEVRVCGGDFGGDFAEATIAGGVITISGVSEAGLAHRLEFPGPSGPLRGLGIGHEGGAGGGFRFRGSW